MADLDTRLSVVIDADPTQMVEIPKGNGMKVNKFSGAVLIDGLGWIADELTKVFEPKQRQRSHFKIIRNANWVGLRVVFAERKQGVNSVGTLPFLPTMFLVVSSSLLPVRNSLISSLQPRQVLGKIPNSLRP